MDQRLSVVDRKLIKETLNNYLGRNEMKEVIDDYDGF